MLVFSILCAGLACRTPERNDEGPNPSASAPGSSLAPDVSAAPASSFVLPKVATASKPGDYVLAPSYATARGIAQHGLARQTVIYYGGWLREAGSAESRVESLAMQSQLIPNALIIAIPRGQHAEPGDIVLTSWASGSGMQRAIVVQGGTREAPLVRYLDMDLESPSGWGRKVDRLGADTFVLLRKPGEHGSTAACREGEHTLRYVVTRRLERELLGLGFAGKLRLLRARDCEFLGLRPDVKRGQIVLVPYLGRFVESEVVRVDADIGRVVVRRKLAGKWLEQAVPVIDVQTRLD